MLTPASESPTTAIPHYNGKAAMLAESIEQQFPVEPPVPLNTLMMKQRLRQRFANNSGSLLEACNNNVIYKDLHQRVEKALQSFTPYVHVLVNARKMFAIEVIQRRLIILSNWRCGN